MRINSVNPVAIATAIGEKHCATEEMMKQFAQMWEDPKMIPLARIGRPREVAELIAFLADRSKSEFIVGQFMIIDGGSSLLNTIFQNWTDQMH